MYGTDYEQPGWDTEEGAGLLSRLKTKPRCYGEAAKTTLNTADFMERIG